ncbi:MICAL-like protein 1 [Drosophila biarmipes]|uniref:MICAL-like protein 1 n=1 Tax=Drosophila biarmipes TaxID=125945 RepID=UPI0007E5C362|nr:MICAL-like protein 1 [Drosophila biarmipes]
MSDRRGTKVGTGTKALEYWCRVITQGYNGVKVENMTTSWRDGLAFCAIIHHFRPDLIDFDRLKATDIYENNDLAFTTAEKYLGIPALLDAADMVSYEVPDRLSILTYLSQFYKVLGKSLKPPKTEEKFCEESEPPQKMMHIVGMPRRDKCQKCELPVFLAERVLVGKRAYHRTCLKCARCSSLLTPGSFYETEVNNIYCCETCPDEESEPESDIVKLKTAQNESEHESDDVELKTANMDTTGDQKLVAESSDTFSDHQADEEDNNSASLSTSELNSISKTPSNIDEQNEDDKQKAVEQNDQLEVDPEKPVIPVVPKISAAPLSEEDGGIPDENIKPTVDPVKPVLPEEPKISTLSLDTEDSRPLVETPLKKLDEQEVISSINTADIPIPVPPKAPTPENNTQEAIEPEDNISCNTENVIFSKTESSSKQEGDVNISQANNLEFPKENSSEVKVAETEYPEDLNPFKDDDSCKGANPFDSSDDEVELLKYIPAQKSNNIASKRDKVVPPRPPPPKIGLAIKKPSEDQHSSPTPSQGKKMPMPTPRITISKPQTPAKWTTQDQKNNCNISASSSENLDSMRSFDRGADDRGSSVSLPSANAPRKPLRASGATPLKDEDLSPTTSLSSITSPMRKKRQAPLPPKQANLESDPGYSKLSDEQKVRRLIPLDQSLLSDGATESSNYDDSLNTSNADEEVNVVYRRILVPPTQPENVVERSKEDQKNPIVYNDFDRNVSPLGYNKSTHGKWKRRKGPAPAVPIPPRKVLQRLPLQEIRHEFEIIAVQQLGLEKQGVILEKMIRDRCERSLDATEADGVESEITNSKEVEDLILQLFELVNEKNELFRRQAELMYLRRQHRLEQEQADIEHEIRVLMGQPEQNKTDSDKAHEEVLINRLVKVVEMRNEVIDSLETDRVREAREDMSIKNRLHIYNSEREEPADPKSADKSSKKLSKKERKKLKEENKLGKGKKSDLDKDVDESEAAPALEKVKKKRNLFFLKM